MQEKLLFENNFVEEENRAVALLEDDANGVVNEPSHGSSSNADVAQPIAKAGFAKATLSKTLPAMVSYVQALNGPTGYVFGFRPKGAAGSTNGQDGVHVINTNTPDAIETQGDIDTTISVLNPISNETSEDFMITRKLISTNMREVKVDMTNEVEQDVVALFGGHFAEMYYNFMAPGETDKKDKVARFFFEYAVTQMVKKTNQAFVEYLDQVATPLGTATITDTDNLIFALAEMQSKLYGPLRKKVAGRTWAICSPNISSAISTMSESFSGWDEEAEERIPQSLENTYVCTMGNMDIYSSTDLADGGVVMGIIGNANISSIYYCPYNEYMINSGADAYTGISNIFFRVRDDWVTNPLDTFSGTQPTPSTGAGDNGYPQVTVEENDDLNNSDYIVKGILTLPTVFA